MKYWLFVLLWFTATSGIAGRLAPGTGRDGTTAIHKDSTVIKAWATGCTVTRGYINIEDTTATYTQEDSTSNRAFFGFPENAVGYPEGNMDVVSLGDGGSAVLTFQYPVTNGEGYDFAVFENGFQSAEPPFGYYLELAFVEVSTDGKRFVRFPAISLTQDTVQTGGFENTDPEKIHNLAGKYIDGYGTPFDLEELKDSSGINIDSVNYIRIVDVVGDINPSFATRDSRGHIINDPWPTPFWTGGFDLNGVAVIHQKESPGFVTENSTSSVSLWPVPASGRLNIKTGSPVERAEIYNIKGNRIIHLAPQQLRFSVNTASIPNGIYFLKVVFGSRTESKIFTIQHQ